MSISAPRPTVVSPTKPENRVRITYSTIFYTQFFLYKEESTGRYIDIRFYDMSAMSLRPIKKAVTPLAQIFEQYSKIEFPPLQKQFDLNFDARYNEYFEKYRKSSQQERFFSLLQRAIHPYDKRIEFDKAVAAALNVDVSTADLTGLYSGFVYEMMITRSLRRD